MTIQENLELLLNTKNAIRQAIIDKGGSVSEADAFAAYATAILDLPSGGGEDFSAYPNLDENVTSYHIEKIGEKIIIATPSAICQIYQGNVVTTQTNYFYEVFVEDKARNIIYAGGDYQSVPLARIEADGSVNIINPSSGYYNNLYLATNGKLYYSSAKLGAGIWCYDAATNTNEKLYTLYSGLPKFWEDRNGIVYTCITSVLYKINDTTVTEISGSTNNLKYVYQAANGDVYIGGSDFGSGIVRLQNDTLTKPLASGREFKHFYEDYRGNMFFSSSSDNGIYMLKSGEDTAEMMFNQGRDWDSFVDDEANNVVYFSSTSNNIGLLQAGDPMGDWDTFRVMSTGYFITIPGKYNGEDTIYLLGAKTASKGVFELNYTYEYIDMTTVWKKENDKYITTDDTKEFKPERGAIVNYTPPAKPVYKLAVVKVQ